MRNRSFQTLLICLFILASLLDIFAIVFDQFHLRPFFKPIIIPLLGFYYVISVLNINKVYLAALFFSFLGDVLLLKTGNTFFVLGLSAFLLNHIMYISIVGKHIDSYKIKGILVASIPFAFILAIIMLLIGNNLGALLIPVLVYGITISAMASLSFYNYLEKRNNTSLLMLFGAFFFVVSDGMIAVEKFELQNKELAVGVMATYVFAQYLICRYMIKSQALLK